MLDAFSIVRQSRRAAGLTQAELAERIGTTQSAVARLESAGANPRVATLLRAVEAAGQQLEFEVRPRRPGVDETMIAANLRLDPAARLRRFAAAYESVASLARKAAPAGGS
jgi:transcriptional regulator with XRE-family HTH domain